MKCSLMILAAALAASTLVAEPSAEGKPRKSGFKMNVASEPAKKAKGWLDDFKQAQKEAADEKRPILALFTGSDWCPWCVKLEKEKLDTKDFKKFAEANLILFKADFPNGNKPSKKVAQQNEELKSKYGVRGFPTVYLLDAEGVVLGRTGYQKGDGKSYVEHITGLMKAKGLTVAGDDAAKPKKADGKAAEAK